MQGEDDGTAIISIAKYLDDREGEKMLGVYALYDSAYELQYVGYARHMVLAIKVGWMGGDDDGGRLGGRTWGMMIMMKGGG